MSTQNLQGLAAIWAVACIIILTVLMLRGIREDDSRTYVIGYCAAITLGGISCQLWLAVFLLVGMRP